MLSIDETIVNHFSFAGRYYILPRIGDKIEILVEKPITHM